ncbi:MAG: GNAT family N-acetyltransferase [Anaerolineales bacterium]
MAGIETDSVRIHALTEADLSGALALTRYAGWNQVEADWRHTLNAGRGWGLSTAAGLLIATAAVLPYPPTFGWISLVLVHPEHRRRGHASRLMQVAIDDLRARQLTPMLDATPAGRAVYVTLGFRDCWGITRLAAKAGMIGTDEVSASAITIRAITADDWSHLAKRDAAAFGAVREPLLREFARRRPEVALVARAGQEISGFLFGREGHTATQLGPLVAHSHEAACALLWAALQQVAGPVYLDLADHNQRLLNWLIERGFVIQRPFTRMALGTNSTAGEHAALVLMAGPEFG